MSRKKLILVLLSTFLLGGIAGAAALYAFFIRDAMSGMIALGDLSVASLYETRINLFGDSGTDEEYEAALREYVDVLDRLRAKHPNGENHASLAQSKVITLARLALVAEKKGAGAEAQQFVNSAVSECQSSKWKDCSPQKLRELAVYFENKRKIHVTSNPK
jgi:hypothetical protein